jgi:hypothetical protein
MYRAIGTLTAVDRAVRRKPEPPSVTIAITAPPPRAPTG